MTESTFRAACLGGGSGVSAAARGLLLHEFTVTALVATTDNGRSTGLVRRLFDIPAPGDVRNVLTAFAADPVARDLFEHRLDLPDLPELTGAAFGNLVLGVLTKTTGSFEAAIEEARRLLGVTIDVAPLTAANTQLVAELDDGERVVGEVEVRRLGKAPIRSIALDPPAPATRRALTAIAQADLVSVGPGSLFTSVIAGLAVGGIAEALGSTKALRVYIANTTTQPGQSDDLPLVDQIKRVRAATGGALDAVLINEALPDNDLVERHRAAGRSLLTLTEDERDRLEAGGLHVIRVPLAETDAPARTLWQKEDAIRHDPTLLGAALVDLLALGIRR